MARSVRSRRPGRSRRRRERLQSAMRSRFVSSIATSVSEGHTFAPGPDIMAKAGYRTHQYLRLIGMPRLPDCLDRLLRSEVIAKPSRQPADLAQHRSWPDATLLGRLRPDDRFAHDSRSQVSKWLGPAHPPQPPHEPHGRG